MSPRGVYDRTKSKTRKVTTVDITPTWETVWRIHKDTLGKIDEETYEYFLPAMKALDALQREHRENGSKS